MDKSVNGFKVKELGNGRSNVSFSWHIVANRADAKLTDGTVFSKHVDVRFPIGPNKISQTQLVENSVLSNTDYSNMEIKIKGKAKKAQKYTSEKSQTGTTTNNPQIKASSSETITETND